MDEDYKESEISKIVKRLMDEEGFEFGEAVKEAMEQTKKFESKADGGSIGIEVLFQPKRQNLFMGGPALEGPSLSIYDSMKAYGATDQAISDAIKRAGYELPTADSGTTTPPDNSNQSTTGGNAEGFSVYNPDPNRTRSFREDPRVAAANEADIRNRTLTKMGIVDPFADEISLSGAYYGDIPDFDDTPGKQSTMAGIKGLMNNPITNAIGFAINPAFGALKGIAKGIGSLFPDQKRPTQENILGNLGFSINDIGQIVSTGDYDDESGSNVMAGYNASRMTPETFARRIASIQNRKAAQTDASRRRIAAIEEAKRKFELSQKLLQEQMEAKRQADIDAINKRKADAKAAGDAEKARKLQIEAAAKAQEISRRQAREQQKAIDKDRGSTTGDGPGGRGDRSGGRSSGSGESDYGGFCFDPSTPIQMADGSEKKIKEIQLGDDTKGGEVTGVFQFKATDEIHDYKGVTVAGSHYVKEDGKFIMVKDSPLSVKIDKIPVVYSLDTTGRRIFINDIEFADYNGDGVAKNFLTNAGVDLTGFDTEVLRQVVHRLI
jgi:hypothetical protein